MGRLADDRRIYHPLFPGGGTSRFGRWRRSWAVGWTSRRSWTCSASTRTWPGRLAAPGGKPSRKRMGTRTSNEQVP